MISFKDFQNKYNGVKNVGDTPENRGQCVGLIEVWFDELGNLPHVWGNAADLYANAPEDSFVKILNTPTAIPQEGDVIVWSGAFNGGVGHTGVATGKADINTFECFEQNDPIGSNPHNKTYNYAYVTGWIRVKTPPIPVPPPQPTPILDLITNSQLKYDFGDPAGIQELGAAASIIHDQAMKINSLSQSASLLDKIKASLFS